MSNVLLVSLAVSTGVIYNIAMRYGSVGINAFTFAVGLGVSALLARWTAYYFFGPALEDVSIKWTDVLVMLVAGIAVGTGDLAFYFLLVNKMPLSIAFPLVFMCKVAMVAVLDKLLFGSILAPPQYLGIFLACVSIYLITYYKSPVS